MTYPVFVEMYHPDLPATITNPVRVATQAVDDHEADGWLLVDGAPPVDTPSTFLTEVTGDARYEQLIPRTGSPAGYVPVLQSDGTLEFGATAAAEDSQVASLIDDTGSATAASLRAASVAAAAEDIGDTGTTLGAAAAAASDARYEPLPPAGLKRWRRDAGSADVDGLRILYGPGASTLQGQGATTMGRRSIERVGARLAARLGLSGSGVVIAPHSGSIVSPVWPVTYSGVTRRFDFGIGHRTIEVPATTGSWTWTFTAPGGVGAAIYYRRGSTTGTISYTIDGGAPVTVATSGSVTEMVKHTTAVLSAGAHTIVGTTTGNNTYIEGLCANPAGQVQMFEAGSYGSSTATWDTNGYSAIGAIDPHLAVVCLGANDQTFGTPSYSVTAAIFQTRLVAMLAKIRAQKANLPVLILGMPEQDVSGYAAGYDSWANFIAAMREVAEDDANAHFFDAGAVLGAVVGNTLGVYADVAHMNDTGQGWWADLFVAEVTAGLVATAL